ncbi:MAG TPA: (2Fe-2S)-binding protein [Devosia sp.]|nr:(2Fe-2S)-binding protein [Devosia sp.]
MFRRIDGYTSTTITVFVDGIPVEATAGEYAAAVLLRTPPHTARLTPLSASPRAPYCMMGVCTDCAATVDGVTSVLTCQTVVTQGMRIDRPTGLPDFNAEDADHAL